jgi:hypothetical protein
MAEGQHPNSRSGPPRAADPVPRPVRPRPLPFRLQHLYLIDGSTSTPVPIASMAFGDDGIGVTRLDGELPRLLPWPSVVAYAVEPWSGGPIPEWWVDPELNRDDPATGPVVVITDPSATSRARVPVDDGALIVVQTQTGIYRFILADADPRGLSLRVGTFAAGHQGPQAVSAGTRAVAWGLDIERRKTVRPPKKPPLWPRIRPFLIVVLVVFVAAAVTVILLQSAGAIHLPLLGGSSGGVVAGTATGFTAR